MSDRRQRPGSVVARFLAVHDVSSNGCFCLYLSRALFESSVRVAYDLDVSLARRRKAVIVGQIDDAGQSVRWENRQANPMRK